jgi:transposase
MNFYNKQHQFYCGIDLHTRNMYICILDQAGKIHYHDNVKCSGQNLLAAVRPFINDIVIAVECIFAWYWVADFCASINLPFVLGHALYMKAIHGSKTKNDKIDSLKIAKLLRAGMLPMAYVYPSAMRSTRDLLRRRMYLVRKRSELLVHVHNTNSQHNLPEFGHRIDRKSNRHEIIERFKDPSVNKNIEVDLKLLDHYSDLIGQVEWFIEKHAKEHHPKNLCLLRTVPGIGITLAMVILYEIHDIGRFPRVQDFASYARLVKCAKESAGKKYGTGNRKIGNAHLKWAFSEAAVLFLRCNEAAKKYHARLVSKHGRGKALSIIAHRLGRAVYFMLKRQDSFDMNKFLA